MLLIFGAMRISDSLLKRIQMIFEANDHMQRMLPIWVLWELANYLLNESNSNDF